MIRKENSMKDKLLTSIIVGLLLFAGYFLYTQRQDVNDQDSVKNIEQVVVGSKYEYAPLGTLCVIVEIVVTETGRKWVVTKSTDSDEWVGRWQMDRFCSFFKLIKATPQPID